MSELGDKAWCEGRKGEAKGRLVEMFHSSISKDAESRILEEFPKEASTIRCVVSTIAFGMGVQINDIDTVIHWGASKSLLSFWQEIGRGGRDGRSARAHMFVYNASLDKRQ